MIRARSKLFPTDRRWPKHLYSQEAIESRRNLYRLIATEPRTAQTASDQSALQIPTVVDHLRILEQVDVVRHRADEMGVVYWHHVPGNVWDMEGPPF